MGKIVSLCHFGNSLVRHTPLCKINAVVHHMIFTLKAKCPKALPCTLADDPDIITGFDIAHHKPDSLIGYETKFNVSADINIIFGVIRKDYGSVCFFP